EHGLRAEVVARDSACGGRVMRIVRVDPGERVDRLVHRLVGEEAFAGRDEAAETAVLRDDWPAGGEIAGAAVAEPAALRPDVDVLRDRELAARLLNEAPVPVD